MFIAIVLGLVLVISGGLLATGVFFIVCVDKIILRSPNLNKAMVYTGAASALCFGMYFLFACSSILSDLLRPGLPLR